MNWNMDTNPVNELEPNAKTDEIIEKINELVTQVKYQEKTIERLISFQVKIKECLNNLNE